MNIAYLESTNIDFGHLITSFGKLEQCDFFPFEKMEDYSNYVGIENKDIDLVLLSLGDKSKVSEYLSFNYNTVTPIFVVDEGIELAPLISDSVYSSSHFINSLELKKNFNTVLLKATLCRYNLMSISTKYDLNNEKQSRLALLGEANAGVSHEINNLLQGLGLTIDLAIKKNAQGKDIRQLLEGLKGLSVRGQTVTRQILNFSRAIEDNNIKVINITDFLEQLVPILRVSIDKSIELVFSNVSKAYYLLGDESQLTFAVINIIKNAEYAVLKKRQDMKITLSITTCKDDNILYLEVSDNGEGIEQHNLEKVFDPLFTTKKRGVGTGFGLSYVKNVVGVHNGVIKVESSLGKGTKIKITLPLTNKQNEESKSKDDGRDANFERKRFLIVDDQREVCDVLKMIIENEGHEVADFYCPLAAFDYFEHFNLMIDVVICDYHMPKMNGHELITKMKDLNKKTRYIISTGDLSLAQNIDGARVLEKPYDCVELLDLVFSDD